MQSKDYLISFWLGALTAFFLWYRNQKTDRTLSTYLFALAILQLLLYGYQSNASSLQVAQAMVMVLGFSLVLIAGTSYFQVSGSLQSITGYLFVVALIVFFALCLMLVSGVEFNLLMVNGQLNLTMNGQVISGLWVFLYAAFVIACLILLNISVGYIIGLAVMIALFAGIAFYFWKNYFCIFSSFLPLFCFLAWATTLEG